MIQNRKRKKGGENHDEYAVHLDYWYYKRMHRTQMLNTHFLTVSQAGPGHVGRKRNQLILMILTVEKRRKVEN